MAEPKTSPATTTAKREPAKPGWVYVKVLRNHDSPLGLLRAGTVVQLPGDYVQTQVRGRTPDGIEFDVTPPVFETLKD